MSARAAKAAQEGGHIGQSTTIHTAGQLGNEPLRKDGARKGLKC